MGDGICQVQLKGESFAVIGHNDRGLPSPVSFAPRNAFRRAVAVLGDCSALSWKITSFLATWLNP